MPHVTNFVLKRPSSMLKYLVFGRSPITHTDEHIPILLKQGYKVTIYHPVKHQTLQWNVVKKEPQEMLILHKDSSLH